MKYFIGPTMNHNEKNQKRCFSKSKALDDIFFTTHFNSFENNAFNVESAYLEPFETI